MTKVDDAYLDLRTLCEKTCMSVRTLRDDIRDPDHPLPCFRKRGKVYIRWSEFCSWMEENFRDEPESYDDKIDAAVAKISGGA